jgi:hypothetical protein
MSLPTVWQQTCTVLREVRVALPEDDIVGAVFPGVAHG